MQTLILEKGTYRRLKVGQVDDVCAAITRAQRDVIQEVEHLCAQAVSLIKTTKLDTGDTTPW